MDFIEVFHTKQMSNSKKYQIEHHIERCSLNLIENIIEKYGYRKDISYDFYNKLSYRNKKTFKKLFTGNNIKTSYVEYIRLIIEIDVEL
jgi:hypothetical protein